MTKGSVENYVHLELQNSPSLTEWSEGLLKSFSFLPSNSSTRLWDIFIFFVASCSS